MNAEQVRAWLAARYDEDERNVDNVHDALSDHSAGGVFICVCDWPARFPAEIAARRRRLERHQPFEVEGIDETWLECTWCHTNQTWPCPDIIDDAQAWADRDDFPAELRLP